MVTGIFLCWRGPEWWCFHILQSQTTSVDHGISISLKPHPLFTADIGYSSGFEGTRCNLVCTFPPRHCKSPFLLGFFFFFSHFRGDTQKNARIHLSLSKSAALWEQRVAQWAELELGMQHSWRHEQMIILERFCRNCAKSHLRGGTRDKKLGQRCHWLVTRTTASWRHHNTGRSHSVYQF